MWLYLFVIIAVAFLTVESVPFHQLGAQDKSSEEDYLDYVDDENSNQILSTNENHPHEAFEKHLSSFLEWYYEKYINTKDSTKQDREDNIDIDQMQADQPDNNLIDSDPGNSPQTFHEKQSLKSLYENLSTVVNSTRHFEDSKNFTDAEYLRVMRNRRHNQMEIRTKDIWIQMLKDNILRKIGRTNGTSFPTMGNEIEIQTFNLSQFLPIPNDTYVDDESIGEKIRSYYPSCELPRNTDQDVWKDENAMNLYFNVDQAPEENGVSIATATLRLYRLPLQNSTLTSVSDSSCENASVIEDDRLLRISIYWYTKSLKKHRVKRRLSDSKVIGESAQYVELSVRPATRAWSKGRNLGLAVLVEDQEGTPLRADKYFKGASCMQHQNLSQPSLSMQQEGLKWNELLALMEQIQQQPCITTYHCSQK